MSGESRCRNTVLGVVDPQTNLTMDKPRPYSCSSTYPKTQKTERYAEYLVEEFTLIGILCRAC